MSTLSALSHPEVISLPMSTKVILKSSWSLPEVFLKSSWSLPEVFLKSSYSFPDVFPQSSWSLPIVFLRSSYEYSESSWSHPDVIMKYSWRNLLWDKLVPWMVWLSTIGVAIYENGVAIYEWCGYLRMVWLSTKKVWLFHLAFLGLLVGAKNEYSWNFLLL